MNNNRVLYHTVLYLASCGLKQSYSISRSSFETFFDWKSPSMWRTSWQRWRQKPTGREKGLERGVFWGRNRTWRGPPRGGEGFYGRFIAPTQPKTAGALSQSVVSRIPYKCPPLSLYATLNNSEQLKKLKAQIYHRMRKTEINHIILVSLHTQCVWMEFARQSIRCYVCLLKKKLCDKVWIIARHTLSPLLYFQQSLPLICAVTDSLKEEGGFWSQFKGLFFQCVFSQSTH